LQEEASTTAILELLPFKLKRNWLNQLNTLILILPKIYQISARKECTIIKSDLVLPLIRNYKMFFFATLENNK